LSAFASSSAICHICVSERVLLKRAYGQSNAVEDLPVGLAGSSSVTPFPGIAAAARIHSRAIAVFATTASRGKLRNAACTVPPGHVVGFGRLDGTFFGMSFAMRAFKPCARSNSRTAYPNRSCHGRRAAREIQISAEGHDEKSSISPPMNFTGLFCFLNFILYHCDLASKPVN